MDNNESPWCVWVYFFVIPVVLNLNVMLLSWYLRRPATMAVGVDHKKKEDMEDPVLILA